ncbi:MAG: EamA family transporter [Candidatus Aenigmatarchaeota archaeon]
MLGAMLSIAAALLLGASTVLQKRSMMGMKGFSLGKLAMDRNWRLSVIVGFCGLLLYLAALGYEPISLVQPVLAVSMVVPLVAGWLFFGEKIGTKWVHVVLILAGVLLLSL